MNVPQLITEIKQRQPLWDRKHEMRHERALIDGLWEEVAILMGQSAKNVKGKWKTLKDTYRKEAKKCLNDPNYRSPWAHYISLSFLYGQLGIDNNDTLTTDHNNSNSSADQENKIEFVYENIEMSIENGESSNPSQSKGVKRKNEDDEYQNSTENDEDLCFFKSLIPHVKHITPQRKMLLRMKIQELVYKEVYSNDLQEYKY